MAQRKGINVPQFTRETKLDQIFKQVSEFIEIDEKNPEDALNQLYLKLSHDNIDRAQKLQVVLQRCFDFLNQVQDYSLNQEEQNKKSGDPEKVGLITISLHDMKHFNELINIIIVQGVYSCLPIGIGIPLEQRRLKDFNRKSKKYSYQKISNSLEILINIIKHLEIIFDKGGDVKELLLKGSGLTDILTALITLTLDYDQSSLNTYKRFERRSDTYNLFSIYTILLQTTKVPRYHAFISERLTLLTIERSNGVITLIDFIVGIRDDEEINIDKFNNVNRVLMAKPKDMTSVVYFNKVFDQIYEILVFVNRPVMLSVAVNFIRVLYFKNKKIIQDFLFKRIWRTLNPGTAHFNHGETIIGAKQLNDVINVLLSLTKESTPEFLNELFSQIILNLWAFLLYLKKRKLEFANIVDNLFVSFFTITSNNEFLENIVMNLVKTGGDDWKFETNLENKLSTIVKTSALDGKLTSEEIFDDLDVGLGAITSLFKNLGNDVVRKQFLIVLNRWISKQGSSSLGDENPFIILIDLKFLEKINDNFKDALMDKPEDVLTVIEKLLVAKSSGKDALKIEAEDNEDEDTVVDSDDEDDEEVQTNTSDSGDINVLLELLSAILSETDVAELSKHKPTLQSISQLLSKFASNKQCISLHQRIESFLNEDHKIDLVDDEKSKDKEILEKAITSVNDPLVPIRAHGLYLLRQLIIKKSPVITLEFVLELHLVQLQDQEPFIYLNVIRSLNELIGFDCEGTIKFLSEFYIKKDEKLDDRLKIGEVLINFIEKSGELFTGGIANKIISHSLSIVQDFEEDNRIRMSAMSLIGQSLRTNATGLDLFIKDSLDCSIGILEMEKEVIMCRSAVVLISDLISFGGLEIVPRGYGEKLKNLLSYVRLNAGDYLLVEQIDKVLEIIDELIRDKFKPTINNQFDSLRIEELK